MRSEVSNPVSDSSHSAARRWVLTRGHLLCIALLLLCGCATSTPAPISAAEPHYSRASGEMLPDPAAAATAATEREVFAAPEQLAGNPMPAYPAAFLTAGLPPQNVVVRVFVNPAGSVVNVYRLPSPIFQVEGYAPFFDAVRDAVMQWRFKPLGVAQWSEGRDLNDDGDAAGDARTNEEPRLFPFDMRFRFEVVDGQVRVSS